MPPPRAESHGALAEVSSEEEDDDEEELRSASDSDDVEEDCFGIGSDDEWGSDLSSSSLEEDSGDERTLGRTRVSRMSTWRRVAQTSTRTNQEEENLAEQFPEKWNTEVVVPSIKLGAKIVASTSFAFLFFYELGIVAIEAWFYCDKGEFRHWFEYDSAFQIWNDFIFYAASIAVACCVRWPYRRLYAVLVLIVMLDWQAGTLIVGTKTRLKDLEWVHDCNWPGNKELCPYCSAGGYAVLLDTMIWLLLMPSVFVQSLWIKIVFWIWIFFFVVVSLIADADSPKEVKRAGAFDALVGVAFVGSLTWLSLRRKRQMLRVQAHKFRLDLDQTIVTQRMFNVLKFMVPTFVIAPMLTSNSRSVDVPDISKASVMFISLPGFDVQARNMPPEDLLMFLNKSFTEFDQVCKIHAVTKIETWKEEYVCAVGVSPADVKASNSAGHSAILDRLVRAAMAMLEFQPTLGADIAFKVGIHTGPVVAGVVGGKLPRFRLFGDTVNTAARMMQKGLKGQVQFGEETRKELPEWVVEHVVPRGQIQMKGKGMVSAYLLQGHPRRTSLALPEGSPATSVAVSFFQPHLTARYSEASPSVARTGVLGALLGKNLRKMTARTPRRLAREYAAAGEFENMMRQMDMRRGETKSIKGRKRFQFCACCICWADFPKNAEEDFQVWFHTQKTCRSIDKRLAYQASCLAALTAIEFLYMLFGREIKGPHPFANAVWDLRVFLACRMLCLFLLMFVRAVSIRGQGIPEGLKAVRYARLFYLSSCCIMSSLLFVSYDTLDMRPNRTAWEPTTYPEGLNITPPAQGVSSNIVLLVFFPVYAVTITAYPFPFHHTLVFLVLTMVLVWIVHRCVKGFGVLPLIVGGNYMVYYALIVAIEAYCEEALFRGQYQASWTVDYTMQRIQGTLEALMPPEVVSELHFSTSSVSHAYPSVTLAQSDLAGFTQLASTIDPAEVVEFISELFGRFDKICDSFEVYKVETVGDAYIAGQGGLPLTTKNSPIAVVRFALQLIEATADWSRKRSQSVGVRVGVHTAPCVGGIVGTDMQRYHLFGELMTCLEILESTSHVGKVHVSKACRDAVHEEVRRSGIVETRVSFEPRTEESLVTSKGEVHQYDGAGGFPTFFAGGC